MKPRVKPRVYRGPIYWWVARGADKTAFYTHAAALAYANEIAGLRATQPAWHRGEKEQP